MNFKEVGIGIEKTVSTFCLMLCSRKHLTHKHIHTQVGSVDESWTWKVTHFKQVQQVSGPNVFRASVFTELPLLCGLDTKTKYVE